VQPGMVNYLQRRFDDARVASEAALAVARELGYAAAREYCAVQPRAGVRRDLQPRPGAGGLRSGAGGGAAHRGLPYGGTGARLPGA